MFSFVSKAHAQIINPVLEWGGGASGESGQEIIGNMFSAVVGMFIVVSFILAFLYLLLGAFRWITAGGDKTKLQEAQDRITQAMIGLILVASVWAIMLLVGQFIGVDFPNLPIPTLGAPEDQTRPSGSLYCAQDRSACIDAGGSLATGCYPPCGGTEQCCRRP